MKPTCIDKANLIYRADGPVTKVYDTNGSGQLLPVTFDLVPSDPTRFSLPYMPCGEIHCDIDGPTREEIQWCTTCGARFTEEEVLGATACPSCGCEGTPCSTDDDLQVDINWHELRILGIWASNFARGLKPEQQQTLRGILSRLERQFPNELPLTLAGELREVREAGYKVTSEVPTERFVEVNGPGAVGHAKPSHHGRPDVPPPPPVKPVA